MADTQAAAAKAFDKPAAATEQLMAMLAGTKAGETAIAAGALTMSLKQRAWLDRRGRLDDRAVAALDARIASDRAQLAGSARETLALARCIPSPVSGKLQVGGRVTRSGKPQEGLVVSLIDRKGKPHGCGETDANGHYSIGSAFEDEVMVLLSDGKRRRRLWLEERPLVFRPGGVEIVDIELDQPGDCPSGPDTSERQTMPDVVGMAVSEAAALLKKQEITVSARKRVEKEGFINKVIATKPAAGRLLASPPVAELTVGVAPKAKPASAKKA